MSPNRGASGAAHFPAIGSPIHCRESGEGNALVLLIVVAVVAAAIWVVVRHGDALGPRGASLRKWIAGAPGSQVQLVHGVPKDEFRELVQPLMDDYVEFRVRYRKGITYLELKDLYARISVRMSRLEHVFPKEEWDRPGVLRQAFYIQTMLNLAVMDWSLHMSFSDTARVARRYYAHHGQDNPGSLESMAGDRAASRDRNLDKAVADIDDMEAIYYAAIR